MSNYKGAYPSFNRVVRELYPDISDNDRTRLIGALRADFARVREVVDWAKEEPIPPGPKPLTEMDRYLGVRPPVSASFEDGDIPEFTGAFRP